MCTFSGSAKADNLYYLQGNLTISFSSVVGYNPEYKIKYFLYRVDQNRPLFVKDYEDIKEGSVHVIGSITNPQDKLLKVMLMKSPLEIITRTFNLEGIMHKKPIDIYDSRDRYITGIKINITAVSSNEFQGSSNEFKPKKGNKVTLYQDAETIGVGNFGENDDIRSIFRSVDGQEYKTYNCWRDIYDAIMSAKKFIYITAWKLVAFDNENLDTPLLRDGIDLYNSSGVGHLLKQKAAEGVDVRILVWDNRNPRLKIGNTYIIKTFDHRILSLLKNFKNTGVIIAPVINSECNECNILRKGLVYSHHQKSIVMDRNDEIVVGFVGGFDITPGRFDTPKHPIQRLPFDDRLGLSEYLNDPDPDFPLPEYIILPWHDIHSKIEGIAALDIYENFKRRWNTQVNDEVVKYIPKIYDVTELANKMENMKYSLGNWTVQVVRSISNLSDNLVGIDDSIHKSYIKTVRLADEYIYIESQFFGGSSNMWLTESDYDHKNMIPFEIVRKIISKIEKKENFTAAVIIPMNPETGKTWVTQDMVFRRQMTISFMYYEIALALNEVYGNNTNVKPTDYLKFFCLGKTLNKKQKIAQGTEADIRWRNQVYVHSKLLIVDDKFVLISSSHVDDRSLVGNRDTEIGMLAYKQGEGEITVFNKEIQTFRMALLSEHMGGYDDECIVFSSTKCLSKLERKSKQFQELYLKDPEEDIEEENKDRMIHSKQFPINVTQEGNVEPIESWINFPDSNSKVEGEESWLLGLLNPYINLTQRSDQRSAIRKRKLPPTMYELRTKCSYEQNVGKTV